MGEAVLVTGAGGFVGSAVVRYLVRRLQSSPLHVDGDMVLSRVLALLRPGGDRTRLAALEPGDAWRIVEADLQRPEDVAEALRSTRPSMVVHTALDRGAYDEDSDSFRRRRIVAPLRSLLRELSAVGGVRFVHTGSSWVLPGGRHLDEDTEPAPASPYARAKALEDRVLPDLAGEMGVQWINLRLFNLFGRYEAKERLIPYLVRRLRRGEPAELSAAENIRDFTDVDLAARAYVEALEAPSEATDVLYHIGTGRGTRIAQIAEWVATVVGRPDLLRFGARDTPDRAMRVQVADIDRARRRLGWSPPDDLEKRVKSMAAWWVDRLDAMPIRSDDSLQRRRIP